MGQSRFRWREAACLSLGIALGLVGSLPFRRASPAPSTATVPSPADPAVAAPSDPRPPGSFPLARRRRWNLAGSPSDWEQAAAEYRAAGSNPSQAHSLLYQLDARALRKLAVNAATWPHGGRTTRALREIYRRWGEVDPMAAFAQLSALDEDTREAVIFEAERGFVSALPPQAAAYFAAPPPADAVGSLRNLGDRRLMLNLALVAWSEQDEEAALGFLGQLPGNTLYPGPAGSLGAELARQNPAAALNWALGLPDQVARSNALQGVVSAWTETDPQAAAAYVLGFSGDVNQGELVGTLVERWAAQDLAAAARWTAEQSGTVQAKAAASLASQWSRDDPAGAAAWAGQLSGDARGEADAAIVANWYGLDPTAARDWLGGLPSGDARDATIETYLEDYRNHEPPTEKLSWAEQIADPQKRDGTLVKVLNDWLSNAPQSARQWISQADLPPAVAGKLNGG